MIFNQCSHCGANLDPGENCDCVKSAEVEKVSEDERANKKVFKEE